MGQIVRPARLVASNDKNGGSWCPPFSLSLRLDLFRVVLFYSAAPGVVSRTGGSAAAIWRLIRSRRESMGWILPLDS